MDCLSRREEYRQKGRSVQRVVLSQVSYLARRRKACQRSRRLLTLCSDLGVERGVNILTLQYDTLFDDIP